MIKIIVDRVPSTPGLCVFHNTDNHKCLIKKHLGFCNKKCDAFCGHSWNNSCPYLMSFDEALEWKESVGKVPDEMGRCIYQVKNGKLPPLKESIDKAPKLEPEYYSDSMIPKVNPHTFTKRRFGR